MKGNHFSLSIAIMAVMAIMLLPRPSDAQVISHQIKSKQSFTFKTSNEDTALFGFTYFFDSTFFSVNSIARMDDFVILIDPIHNNVKSVSVSEGRLRCSQVLLKTAIDPNRIPPYLMDVYVMGNYIYVTSSSGFLFTLDRDLLLVNKSQISFDRTSDPVFFSFNGRLFIFGDVGDVVENSNHRVSVRANCVKGPKTLIPTMVEIEGDWAKFDDICTGFKKKDDCLLVENNSYCLDGKFPDAQYQLTRQIWISDRSISFYSVVDEKVVLSVYDFN
ncbi:MAG: hypothetical protein JNN04_04820 [Cyclobacteriaceae bacterium]|nr:hypothetical protein [Cyclobacteriaceae bacterium]